MVLIHISCQMIFRGVESKNIAVVLFQMSSVVSVLAQANRAKNKVRSVSTIRHQSEPFKKNPFVAQYFHLMSNTPISIRSDVEFVRRVRRQAHVKKMNLGKFSRINAKIPFLFYSPNSSKSLLKVFFHKNSVRLICVLKLTVCSKKMRKYPPFAIFCQKCCNVHILLR